MKDLVCILALFVLGAVAAYAQRPLTEVDLTVNGIRSGSSLQKVFKLGKPLRIKYLGFNESASKYERTYYFEGLQIGILGSKSGKSGFVYSMRVTSNRWVIAPGFRIGTRKDTILRKFGKPVQQEINRLGYVTKENLGWVWFEFRGDNLIRAVMTETLC